MRALHDSLGADATTPQTLVFILGMHRSGTSCLTGTLQQHGLFLGKHHTWNKHNQRGNRENQDVVDLHDAILAANGGAWDAPPRAVVWKDAHFERAREILGEYAHEPVWGFKDPRALLALDGWKRFTTRRHFVGVFRNPIAVAHSLHQRNEMPHAKAYALWYAYNRLLYREVCAHAMPLLSFDDPPEVFQTKATNVARELGLELAKHGDAPFYAEDLVHHSARPAAARVPWRVRRLYARLRKLAI